MIKVTAVDRNKPVRTFPCLLMGYSSGNYYYAKSKYSGYNLTSGNASEFMSGDPLTFDTDYFIEVRKIELSMEA